MKLRLFDTMSREIRPLEAENGKDFGFYCCGPTVYGPAHIGNFRTFLLQDVLRRVLEVTGTSVTHVRNITDVDDKTIRESIKENVSLSKFTQKWTEKFHNDCESLNMLPPTEEPKATEHIKEQIEIIENLVLKNYAYVSADGSVYFKVDSYDRYGELTRLKKSELKTQSTTSGDALNMADEYDRETVADFALWKSHKEEDGDNYWESPWGKGRPGWHIECSAMSIKYLGNTFDLHGGGIDLVFPHHENEIAQTCCHTGEAQFARNWFHCTHLMVEGEKMSKSIGNLYTLDDLKEKGYSPNVVRYSLLAGDYRQQLNFTFNGLNAAKSALAKIEKEIRKFMESQSIDFKELDSYICPPDEDFFESDDAPFKTCWAKLTDDLNIPAALGELFSMIPFQTEGLDQKKFLTGIGSLLYALGIKFEVEEKASAEIPTDITTLAEQRWEAKNSKDWARADTLRDELASKGWIVKDRKDGYDIEILKN